MHTKIEIWGIAPFSKNLENLKDRVPTIKDKLSSEETFFL